MDSTDKFWAYVWFLGALTLVAIMTIVSYRSLAETKLYGSSSNPIELACAKQADSVQMNPVCVTYFNTK
jgi:hypothetical protein